MYAMQSYSRLLSETPIEKGPPYPPGAWLTFNGPLGSLVSSVEAFKRVMAPSLGDTKSRNRDDYRIVRTTMNGAVRQVFDIDGNAILPTVKSRSVAKAA